MSLRLSIVASYFKIFTSLGYFSFSPQLWLTIPEKASGPSNTVSSYTTLTN